MINSNCWLQNPVELTSGFRCRNYQWSQGSLKEDNRVGDKVKEWERTSANGVLRIENQTDTGPVYCQGHQLRPSSRYPCHSAWLQSQYGLNIQIITRNQHSPRLTPLLFWKYSAIDHRTKRPVSSWPEPAAPLHVRPCRSCSPEWGGEDRMILQSLSLAILHIVSYRYARIKCVIADTGE